MIFYPSVLILSSKLDFSSDKICLNLRERNIPYLRINRDELAGYDIEFDPITCTLIGEYQSQRFFLDSTKLKSIFFRAPTFLRDIYREHVSEEEQLTRTQWEAFVRSLVIFDNIFWVNNPVHTYRAEIKPYQLKLANELHFVVPQTKITNILRDVPFELSAIKTIDTGILSGQNQDGFIYTSILKKEELINHRFDSPFILQEGLVPKIDLRITVIGNEVIPIKIEGEELLDDDWRKYKHQLKYSLITIPEDLKQKCLALLKKLNLNFGAIDMIYHNDRYYFIEINPTGEWSWLQHNTSIKFDEKIASLLAYGNDS